MPSYNCLFSVCCYYSIIKSSTEYTIPMVCMLTLTWPCECEIRWKSDLNLKFIIKCQHVHVSLPVSNMCRWQVRGASMGLCAGDRDINLAILKMQD